ncbi:hypothetical protein FHU41_002347 [Psychromicrobium silvestre]|uniref:Uncharacterized protein n=1 Tax=Psychromicrobium silvestre TaxID=1645614 RepID=A0A7Y9S987_9MICC|nr:hypothetical protein [Psychromicrobium silvestre]NYE96097.1 hypothetical protein [Psychromicrobium silvestre]
MSENPESIEIHELDENGMRLAVNEIETEIQAEASNRFNPWLIGLWALSGALILLTVLGFIGSAQTPAYANVTFDSSGPVIHNETSWLSVFAPFTVGFLIPAFISLFTTLVLHAVFWERRRRA